MTEQQKNDLFKIVLIYVCFFGTITLITGVLKVASLFYKQVIL
jgi:hypothetical protein